MGRAAGLDGTADLVDGNDRYRFEFRNMDVLKPVGPAESGPS